MWFIQNLGTIITALVVCLMVFLAARSVWKNKKAGRSCGSCSSCGCGCGGCKPSAKGSSAERSV